MRIARIVERLPPLPGGKEKHAASLTGALASLGVEQHVFFRCGEAAAEEAEFTQVGAGRDTGSRVSLARFAARCRTRVAREHRRKRFDLVHTHGDFAEAACAALLSRDLAIPAILSVHGGLSRTRWHNAVRLGSFSSMQRVLATSASLADEVRAAGVSSPTFVRRSGVDDLFFNAPRAPTNPPTVVSVGHVGPVKGLEHLVAARDLLAGQRELRWVIAGEALGEYGERIRSEVARRADMTMTVGERVVDVARVLGSASVFVLPSVDLPSKREGTSTAMLEAIAAGVPIVATDAGGTADALAGGAHGLVVPPADARALAAAIGDVLDDQQAAAARAARARASGVAERWTRVADEVLCHYRDAIAEFERRSVVFALPQLDVGGAERIVVDLANGAADAGLRVGLAAAPGSLVRELRGVAVAQLERRGTRCARVRNFLAMTGLMIRVRPTAVNSHHFPTGVLARCASAASRLRTRHVLTVHGPERRWYAVVLGVASPYLFDRVLFVADHVRRTVSRFTLPTRRGRFAVVYAGVELDGTEEAREQAVGVVARLAPTKGHGTLLHAWRGVVTDQRANGWRLEIWGDGAERATLAQLACALGIESTVVFRGTVTDAGRKLGRFAVVVLPSLYEALPLVLIEAMARRCCVVASDIPGCREVLGADSGVLVPPNDSSALARALLRMIVSPEDRDAYGERARARVEQRFRRDRMVSDYLGELRLSPRCRPGASRPLPTALA